jgi:hypothetical protein
MALMSWRHPTYKQQDTVTLSQKKKVFHLSILVKQKHKISQKSVQWELLCLMQMNARMDIHTPSHLFTPFCFNAPCQFTPLRNLHSLNFGIMPFGWMCSIMLTPYF